VFLDRDGVLNRPIVRDGRPYPPLSVDQFALYPEASDACRRLRTLGFSLVVVTNQPDVARGGIDAVALGAIHDELQRLVELDAVCVCPHDDADGCGCRKPAPGLLVEAAADLGLDLGRSIMVGDRWRDVEAGQRAGCRTVHIDRGYCERHPDAPDAVAADLAQAVRWIEKVVVGKGVADG